MTGITEFEELSLAVRSIRAAASMLENGSYGAPQVDIIGGREWKIQADRDLEEEILRVLRRGSTYPILTEESGRLAGKGDRYWVVDPLDGSANFVRNLPFYAISVGLWQDKSPLIGAVLEVPTGRLFRGISGQGAWCDDKPIYRCPENCPPLAQSILCTGLPVGFDHSVEELQRLIKPFQHYGKTRMLGSAALMLCYVASGQVDSYFERGIALWDVGAALAIVLGAGGCIRIGEIREEWRLDIEAAGSEDLLMSNVVRNTDLIKMRSAKI